MKPNTYVSFILCGLHVSKLELTFVVCVVRVCEYIVVTVNCSCLIKTYIRFHR